VKLPEELIAGTAKVPYFVKKRVFKSAPRRSHRWLHCHIEQRGWHGEVSFDGSTLR
jgi:hypothetical protein